MRDCILCILVPENEKDKISCIHFCRIYKRHLHVYAPKEAPPLGGLVELLSLDSSSGKSLKK